MLPIKLESLRAGSRYGYIFKDPPIILKCNQGWKSFSSVKTNRLKEPIVVVLNLGCTLKSPGEHFEILMPRFHLKSESLVLGPRHQYFLKLPGGYHVLLRLRTTARDTGNTLLVLLDLYSDSDIFPLRPPSSPLPSPIDFFFFLLLFLILISFFSFLLPVP